MPIPLLVAIFIAVPIAELYLIYTIGDTIGVLPTLLLLAIDSVLGSLLLRSQGRAVWRRFNETMAAGRVPHQELQHGIAVIFGGALLVTPGFLSDVVGLLLLLPPTRAVILRLVVRRLSKRVEAQVVSGGARPRSRDADVEGSATEYPPREPPPLER
ncbi:MAG: FxsA family protein [Thermoleophilaceae bacterium]